MSVAMIPARALDRRGTPILSGTCIRYRDEPYRVSYALRVDAVDATWGTLLTLDMTYGEPVEFDLDLWRDGTFILSTVEVLDCANCPLQRHHMPNCLHQH